MDGRARVGLRPPVPDAGRVRPLVDEASQLDERAVEDAEGDAALRPDRVERAVDADEVAAGAGERVLRRVHQVPALVDPQAAASTARSNVRWALSLSRTGELVEEELDLEPVRAGDEAIADDGAPRAGRRAFGPQHGDERPGLLDGDRDGARVLRQGGVEAGDVAVAGEALRAGELGAARRARPRRATRRGWRPSRGSSSTRRAAFSSIAPEAVARPAGAPAGPRRRAAAGRRAPATSARRPRASRRGGAGSGGRGPPAASITRSPPRERRPGARRGRARRGERVDDADGRVARPALGGRAASSRSARETRSASSAKARLYSHCATTSGRSGSEMLAAAPHVCSCHSSSCRHASSARSRGNAAGSAIAHSASACTSRRAAARARVSSPALEIAPSSQYGVRSPRFSGRDAP